MAINLRENSCAARRAVGEMSTSQVSNSLDTDLMGSAFDHEDSELDPTHSLLERDLFKWMLEGVPVQREK